MAGVDSIAFNFSSRSAQPMWEGCGASVLHDATPDEMLVAAKIDWTVSKRPCFVPTAAGSEDVATERIRASDIFALVRDDTNAVLGPAGKMYVPTQNRQAMDFFKKFAAVGNLTMDTAGSLHGGRNVWALARLQRVLQLPGGDEVRGFLLFSNPHRWGESLVIKFCTVRVVCGNTFAMAMSESTYGKGFRMPHVRAFDFEAAKEAEVTLQIANELFEGFEANAGKLAAAKVSQDVVVRYIADAMSPAALTDLFGKGFYRQPEIEQARLIAAADSPRVDVNLLGNSAYEVVQTVKSQPGADLESSKDTLWGAWNALTYHADHIAGQGRDNAIDSAWFGPRSVLKTKAFKRALQVSTYA